MTEELASIKESLCRGKEGTELKQLSENFDQMIPSHSNEPIFAVACKNNTPILIYSVHQEFKLTRGLSHVRF